METVMIAPIMVQEVKESGWQYKLVGKVDAISPTYDVNNISMDKKLGTPVAGHSYICKFERGNLRKDQRGNDKDDTKTWNWFWDISEFNIQEQSSPAPSGGVPSPTAVFNTQTDVNPTTRLTQTATNVRTALMQSVEMGKSDGIVTDTTNTIFERADELLKYLNDRIFGSSPLVQKAVSEGAVIKSIAPIPDSPSSPLVSVERGTVLKKDWEIPVAITDGREFKEFCLGVQFEMEWVMKKFQEIGICKSADFVTSEQGTYLDLAIFLCNLAETEKIANPHKDNGW